MDTIRLLLLADTHIGIDTPARPRIERRRRGADFMANYRTALEPALRGEVDLVVHGGDLLYRSKVPPRLVQDAMEPLFEVADAGVPVFLVPGNHERSKIPYPLLTIHPLVFHFDRPRSYVVEVRGARVALAGFPFVRDVGERFAELLRASRWRDEDAGVRLLCAHQSFCGARVGPAGFTFRAGPDVVGSDQLPYGFAAVLSGHIHRAQTIARDADGRRWPSPVVYPGSVERTSFAEADEEKSYSLLTLEPSESGGRLVDVERVALPARPMVRLEMASAAEGARDADAWVRRRLAALAPDSVVTIRASQRAARGLTAARLRELAPATMNVTLQVRDTASEGM